MASMTLTIDNAKLAAAREAWFEARPVHPFDAEWDDDINVRFQNSIRSTLREIFHKGKKLQERRELNTVLDPDIVDIT